MVPKELLLEQFPNRFFFQDLNIFLGSVNSCISTCPKQRFSHFCVCSRALKYAVFWKGVTDLWEKGSQLSIKAFDKHINGKLNQTAQFAPFLLATALSCLSGARESVLQFIAGA